MPIIFTFYTKIRLFLLASFFAKENYTSPTTQINHARINLQVDMFHSFRMIWWSLAIIAMRCYGVYIARSHLKKIRLIKGYTIRELASRSGITREWIERIEKQNNPNLRIATICKLAEALDVRPEELITYEWITNKWALTAQREEWYHRYRTNVLAEGKKE